ncbi:MAG: tetratricopeptide repeat protein [Bacteroidales bacterium]|nr:tetratricopeptide repeat protein [Bacteroidales bacterium]
MLCLASSMTAQQMESEYDGKPDKKKNATFFSNGLQSKYREDTEGAIRNFEQALRFMPDDAASMYELSEQYSNAGRIEEAFNMIQKAAKIEPENKWYQMRLGLFYRNLEQYNDFIKLYEKLTQKYPEDPDMLSELIDAYLVTENYSKALEKMDLLEQQVGENEFITEQRLQVFKRQGNTKKVVSELEKLIEQNPDNIRYYGLLASFYAENGKIKEAIKTYEKIEEINPEHPYINVSLLELYDMTGDKDKAFDELLAAIRNKNLDITTKANTYDYWMNKNQGASNIDEQARLCGEAFVETHPDNKLGYLILGSCYFIEENAVKSKELYQKVLTIDSTDFFGWQNLIISESRLNENEAVRDHAVAALKYYPMQPVFYWYAGVANAVMENNEDAISYLEKGRRYTSDKMQMSEFDAFLGDIYHQQGEEDKAFDAYDRTLRNNPDNALVLNNYAYYLSLRGERLEEALEMAIHANELVPDNVYYTDTYAWVLYKLGRYKEAEKIMKKCLGLEKNPSGANLEHYGDILLKLGKESEAMEYWKKAQQAGGASKELDQKLKH